MSKKTTGSFKRLSNKFKSITIDNIGMAENLNNQKNEETDSDEERRNAAIRLSHKRERLAEEARIRKM